MFHCLIPDNSVSVGQDTVQHLNLNTDANQVSTQQIDAVFQSMKTVIHAPLPRASRMRFHVLGL